MNERTCAAAHSSQPLRLRPCLLWSAALGRLSKLRTLGLHALPTGAATSSATASEHGHVQAAGQLRWLYFGTVVGEANFWLLGCRLMADSVSSRRSRAVALQKLGGGVSHNNVTDSQLPVAASNSHWRPSADGDDWQLAMLLFGMLDWMFTWLRSVGRLTHDSIAPIVIELFMGGLETISLPARAKPKPKRPPAR